MDDQPSTSGLQSTNKKTKQLSAEEALVTFFDEDSGEDIEESESDYEMSLAGDFDGEESQVILPQQFLPASLPEPCFRDTLLQTESDVSLLLSTFSILFLKLY